MRRGRIAAALAALLLLAGSAAAIAAAPAPRASYPTGRFEVAGHVVPPADVLDARALPGIDGKPSLMVTLVPAAAKPLAGARVVCTLDGKPLGAGAALGSDGVLMLAGDFGDLAAASALARRISGRDPVPDSETDE